MAPTALFGVPIDQVNSSVQADLHDAMARYASLQQTIKEEKIPLSKALNDLKAELRDLRREAERAQRFKDNSTIDLNSLQDRVAKRQEQLDYVANLVADFGERFERDISLPEQQLYSQQIDQFRAAANAPLEDDELGKAKRLLDQVFIVSTSIERFESLIGGLGFSGQAVVSNGEVEQGKFFLLGPTAYFASTVGEDAGVALRTGLLPPVISLSPSLDEKVRSTILSGSGLIPVDPTLGSALAMAAQDETIWEHTRKGGIWIWPIVFFAFLATMTAIFKAFEIYRVKMPQPGSLHGILKALNDGDRSKAMELAKAVQGPARAMLVDAVEHSDESKELVEEVMYERMLEVQPRLERLLPFIAVTAATAPLMGLLGTVTGMINTFKLITIFGTGDAKQLSSGISEALITTEYGLIVAIPALIMHALLNRRAQGVMANMERMAVAFVNGLAVSRSLLLPSS
ncbi:MAG TPA: MotA/TolQ/ExbB proton channel family protein [Oceanipulchritudo sp.]|nr:MotA/TolQ/ExbB proton channel family protein [Oceanipulchritudo sp.]